MCVGYSCKEKKHAWSYWARVWRFLEYHLRVCLCVFSFFLIVILAAAVEGLEELKVSDSTGSKDDEEQCKASWSLLIFSDDSLSLKLLLLCLVAAAKRQSMLEEIERDFQGIFHTTSVGVNLAHIRPLSIIWESLVSSFILTAATESLKQLQVDGSSEDTEQSKVLLSFLKFWFYFPSSCNLRRFLMYCYSWKEAEYAGRDWTWIWRYLYINCNRIKNGWMLC